MSRTDIIRKSASVLLHPVTLAAIALLFLNDNYLRWVSPSWITGKLGDFAWLFFIPFVLIIPLAWILPKQSLINPEIPAWLSFGLVGLVFTLGKTSMFFHFLIDVVFQRLFGEPANLRLDPTDLIALLAMIAAWLLWKRAPILSSQRLRLTWLIVPICAWLTIASQPVTSMGITCVMYELNHLYAITYVGNYTSGGYFSNDGGETWKETYRTPRTTESICNSNGFNGNAGYGWKAVTDPEYPNIVFRYLVDAEIEISKNGGENWTVNFVLDPFADAKWAYIENVFSNPVRTGRLLSAAADPVTHNIAFSMGYEGILLRRSNGDYAQVSVGPYHPINLDQPKVILINLKFDLWQAFILGCLAAITLSLHAFQSKAARILFALIWFGWAIVVILFEFPPEKFWGTTLIRFPALPIIILLSIYSLLAISYVIREIRLDDKQHLREVLIAPFVFSGLYLLPFLLWSQDLLPTHALAKLIAILICSALLIWRLRVTTALSPYNTVS